MKGTQREDILNCNFTYLTKIASNEKIILEYCIKYVRCSSEEKKNQQRHVFSYIAFLLQEHLKGQARLGASMEEAVSDYHYGIFYNVQS